MLCFKFLFNFLCLIDVESFIDFIGTQVTTERRHQVSLTFGGEEKGMLSVLNLSLQFNAQYMSQPLAPIFKNSTSYIFKTISITYKL